MVILVPCKSIECFIQSVSVISLSTNGLFLIPSLLICIFVAQVLLLELLKIAKKVGGHLFERTLVRLFGDSNKCPFEQLS